MWRELCDECGEIEVEQSGDLCPECEADLIEAEADLTWQAEQDGSWTPGER